HKSFPARGFERKGRGGWRLVGGAMRPRLRDPRGAQFVIAGYRTDVNARQGSASPQLRLYRPFPCPPGDPRSTWRFPMTSLPLTIRSLSAVVLAALSLGAATFAQRTTRASLGPAGAQGDADSYYASFSADGHLLAFYSEATNLVLGDANATDDVFVRDLLLRRTVLASVATSGAQANGDSDYAEISADGR